MLCVLDLYFLLEPSYCEWRGSCSSKSSNYVLFLKAWSVRNCFSPTLKKMVRGKERGWGREEEKEREREREREEERAHRDMFLNFFVGSHFGRVLVLLFEVSVAQLYVLTLQSSELVGLSPLVLFLSIHRLNTQSSFL